MIAPLWLKLRPKDHHFRRVSGPIPRRFGKLQLHMGKLQWGCFDLFRGDQIVTNPSWMFKDCKSPNKWRSYFEQPTVEHSDLLTKRMGFTNRHVPIEGGNQNIVGLGRLGTQIAPNTAKCEA